MPGQERRLVHVELVGADRALHDVLAQTVRAGDEHHVAEARLGVEREHHAGRRQIGAHHLHDADRQAEAEVIEAAIVPVVNRAVGEQARETAAARLEQRRIALDVQIRLVLAGEAGGRQVFGRRGAAHRDGHVSAVLLVEAVIGSEHFVLKRVRKAGGVHDVARLLAPVGQIGDVRRVERIENRVKPVPCACGRQRVTIGRRRHRKPVRHEHALRPKRAIQLAERRILAADDRHVAEAELGEEPNIYRSGHGCTFRHSGPDLRPSEPARPAPGTSRRGPPLRRRPVQPPLPGCRDHLCP